MEKKRELIEKTYGKDRGVKNTNRLVKVLGKYPSLVKLLKLTTK